MLKTPLPLRCLHELRLPLLAFGAVLCVSTSARALLMLSGIATADSLRQGLALMFWGLRLDLQFIAYALAPLILLRILSWGRRSDSLYRRLFPPYLAILVGLSLFLEIATPAFMEEFGVRPNRLFFEYLSTPGVVLRMLWADHGPLMLAGIFAVAGASIVVWVQSRHWARRSCEASFLGRLLLLLLIFAAARGSLAHRPLNPASAAITDQQLLNELPMSSAYALGYAIYSMRYERGLETPYGQLPEAEVLALVNSSTPIQLASLSPSTDALPKRQNFVLILEESLGAEFVKRLGGVDATPALDQLADQSWWFEQLYATGTRSVRGIEAVTTGFPPSPARSVVKLPRSQQNFYTIARTLAAAGYRTHFVYGGDANFDNMRRFLSNNGFQSVVEQKDFAPELDRTTWGVTDDHLLDRVDQILREAPAHEPQFVFAFTSTNHTPFDFPADRITPLWSPVQRVENAVLYADWALGRFMDRAKASSYWSNSLFLVVADHNSRAAGRELIPVERFHIPGLFLGGRIRPRSDPRLVSQLDLPVTALGLLGINHPTPMIGQDLRRPEVQQRALMQYRDNYAYMIPGGQLALLRPNLPPSTWTLQEEGLQAAASNPSLEKLALAHAQWARLAYEKDWYRAH